MIDSEKLSRIESIGANVALISRLKENKLVGRPLYHGLCAVDIAVLDYVITGETASPEIRAQAEKEYFTSSYGEVSGNYITGLLHNPIAVMAAFGSDGVVPTVRSGYTKNEEAKVRCLRYPRSASSSGHSADKTEEVVIIPGPFANYIRVTVDNIDCDVAVLFVGQGEDASNGIWIRAGATRIFDFPTPTTAEGFNVEQVVFALLRTDAGTGSTLVFVE